MKAEKVQKEEEEDKVDEPKHPHKLQEKSLERVDEEMEPDDETDEEFFHKMHEGLVKIQALVRGVIARKWVKTL